MAEQKQLFAVRWWRSLAFWAGMAWGTVAGPRLARLARRRLAGQQVQAEGLHLLPQQGVFILAANHLRGADTLSAIAAMLVAAGRARPELADHFLVITGRPAQRPPPRPSRFSRRLNRYIRRHWDDHLLVLTGEDGRPSLQALRAWRRRAATQPVIVLPEGVNNPSFGAVRAGAGRWLSGFAQPTVPVGVWAVTGGWQVRFGPALRWAPRTELRDAQLALSIALLLPPEMAPDWQEDLRRWRETWSEAERPAQPLSLGTGMLSLVSCIPLSCHLYREVLR